MEVITEGKKRDSIATRTRDRRLRKKRQKEVIIEDEEDPDLAQILNENQNAS